jgi:hypothetical protein
MPLTGPGKPLPVRNGPFLTHRRSLEALGHIGWQEAHACARASPPGSLWSKAVNVSGNDIWDRNLVESAASGSSAKGEFGTQIIATRASAKLL